MVLLFFLDGSPPTWAYTFSFSDQWDTWLELELELGGVKIVFLAFVSSVGFSISSSLAVSCPRFQDQVTLNREGKMCICEQLLFKSNYFWGFLV